MNMHHLKKWVLYVGVAVLMTHELDAARNSEWQVLPITSWLSPEMGYEVFLWAHVPLFATIIALFSNSSNRIRNITSLVLAGFLVIHAGLHWLFSSHEHYHFESISSNMLIYGGGAFGILYLALNSSKSQAV